MATREALRSAKTLEDATVIIVEALIKRISGIMSLPLRDIDSGKPVHFYGVDSLVAVEFRNWLGKNLGLRSRSLTSWAMIASVY